MYSSKTLEKLDLKKLEKIPINKDTITILKELKIYIEKLNMKIEIGTQDAPITSYIVTIISTILTIVLSKVVKSKDKKNCYYSATPLYNGMNTFNLQLDSIISLKIVHIIYVIYHLAKKGRKVDERTTSNRRSYAYSHECN